MFFILFPTSPTYSNICRKERRRSAHIVPFWLATPADSNLGRQAHNFKVRPQTTVSFTTALCEVRYHFSQLLLKQQIACHAIRRFCFNVIRFLSLIEAIIRDLNAIDVRVECVCRIIGMLGVWSVILAAVDADFGVRLRLRAPETVAFAVVDLRIIKPERKAVVFGNCFPMFDGSCRT